MAKVTKAIKYSVEGHSDIGVLLKIINDGRIIAEIHTGFDPSTLERKLVEMGVAPTVLNYGMLLIEGNESDQVMNDVHKWFSENIPKYKKDDLKEDRSISF